MANISKRGLDLCFRKRSTFNFYQERWRELALRSLGNLLHSKVPNPTYNGKIEQINHLVHLS